MVANNLIVSSIASVPIYKKATIARNAIHITIKDNCYAVRYDLHWRCIRRFVVHYFVCDFFHQLIRLSYPAQLNY